MRELQAAMEIQAAPERVWEVLTDGRAYPPEELPLTRAIERGEMAVAEEVQLDRYDGTRAGRGGRTRRPVARARIRRAVRRSPPAMAVERMSFTSVFTDLPSCAARCPTRCARST